MRHDNSPPRSSGADSDFAALLGSLTTPTPAGEFRDTSDRRIMTTDNQGESLRDLINSASLSATNLFTGGVGSGPLSSTDVKTEVKVKIRPSVRGNMFFTQVWMPVISTVSW